MRHLSKAALVGLAVTALAGTAGCSVGPGGYGNAAARVDTSRYPSDPVQVIVPYEAGGATDQMVRVISQPIADGLGTEPLVVLNQPGGAGTIGTTRVVGASPDGYTLGVVAGGPLTVQPHYGRTIYSYDDVTPVARLAVAPIVLAVPASSPWQTLDDMIAAARTTPGSVRYASTGAGNPANLAMEKLDGAAGIETTQVPFDSSGEAVTAVLGGNVEAAAGVASGFVSSLRSGKLRLLANLGSVKGAGYETVPTLAELGHDAATDITTGIIGPPDLPVGYRDKIAAAVRAALDRPDIREQIERTGAVPRFAGPDEYRAEITDEYQQNGEVLHAAGLI